MRSPHAVRDISVDDLSPEEAQALHKLRAFYAEKLCGVLAGTPVDERVLTFATATIDFVSLRPIGAIEEWLDRADRLIAGQASTQPHAAVVTLLSEFFEHVPSDFPASVNSTKLARGARNHAERRKLVQILASYAKAVREAAPQAKPGLFLVYGSIAMLFGTEWAPFVIQTTRQIILSEANRAFRQAIELGPKATVH
ncbi:MAG: hypothetical protein HYR63_11635 [Proteobacteria bacterium]|nr:hypothetical protein [Pseudomonadota bacterium]MBI3496369.1 hypothetical protein [Pseudomonadota bacterium]